MLQLPLEKNPDSIRRLVAGDCGNPLFTYVPTYAHETLVRKEALAGLGGERDKSAAAEKSKSKTDDMAEILRRCRAGDCKHSMKPSKILCQA